MASSSADSKIMVFLYIMSLHLIVCSSSESRMMYIGLIGLAMVGFFCSSTIKTTVSRLHPGFQPFPSPVQDFEQTQLQGDAAKIYYWSRRQLMIRSIQRQAFDPSITTLPTTVTNPVTTPSTVTNPVTTPSTVNAPPDTSTPTVITVPSGNPTTGVPVNTPTPVSNPVATPGTNTPGGTQPVSNPVTTPASGVPVTTPGVTPPAITTNPPASGGQSWCVAKSGVPEAAMQSALDYACGHGADCSALQQGAPCYSPTTLQNHASYAFNSYYQKNPVQTSCDFGGAATVTSTNPSSGSCVYTTSSSGTPSPSTTNPTTPTPNTASTNGATPTGSGAPPTGFNGSIPGFGSTNPTTGGGTINPAFGGGSTGFADSPQAVSTSMSSMLQPFINCIIFVTSILTGRILLDV